MANRVKKKIPKKPKPQQKGVSGYLKSARQVNKEIDEILNGTATVKGGRVQ